jgi:mannose-1-phosphate guanylyltransferase
MKALLLAAGLGTRLRPLTDETPKCLIPIKGRPLLDIWIEILLNCNITKILINTHYLYNLVEEFINNSPYKSYITLVYEDKLLGTGGTLLKNKFFFDNNEPFIVIHADNYCKCNFKDFINSHFYKPSYTLMTMMIFKTHDPKSCGIVELDNNNVVQKFH